jgi:hypothetical protein
MLQLPAPYSSTPTNDCGESAKEILDKYEKYTEFINACLALSTSAFTDALN